MKYYSTQSLFKFSWDQISSAFWCRYPNPNSMHVLSEDTVVREVRDGKLYSKRMLTKTNKLPKWGERFVRGPKYVCIVEESVVDPVSRTLTTYTRNIGMARIMFLEEKCVYRQNVDHRDWTTCDRQAWVTSSIFGFSYALQHFGIDRFKKNALKAAKGFEYVLNKLYLPASPAPEHTHVKVKAEKLKETAIKAKELAKSKAASVVATNTN